ncbi:MAG: carboxypeptidase-like regulatory domain-containing protein [Planctomycetota bacterium]|nr:carboxypeptidase-like regulatory domain-containing protein [Planctomycetota bacterium]
MNPARAGLLDAMNHRNVLILLGTACICIAVGVTFFSRDTLASATPGYIEAPEGAPQAARSGEEVAARPAEATFGGDPVPTVAVVAPEREDTAGWTSGVIRGDVQLAVSLLDKLGPMTVIVEELRSSFARDGIAPRRIMQRVERGRGTPTFEVRDVPFSDYPYRITLHTAGLNASARTLSVNEQQPLHEDVVLAVTPGAPYSVLLRDQDGGPHRDVDLVLRPVGMPHGRARLAGKTDNFGSVVFESVLAGQYELSATLQGQPFGAAEVVAVLPGKRSFGSKIQGQGHVMTVARGVQLDIEVGDGAYGIEGAEVTLIRTDRRRLQEFQATTDGIGRVRFPHLQPGQWQVTIEREHFRRVDRQITLKADMEPQFQRIKMSRSGF